MVSFGGQKLQGHAMICLLSKFPTDIPTLFICQETPPPGNVAFVRKEIPQM